MIKPEWFFGKPIGKYNRKKNSPNPFKQIARKNTKINGTHLNKDLAEKLINPFLLIEHYNVNLI